MDEPTTDPTDPTDPVDPTDPTDPVDPTDPTDSTEPGLADDDLARRIRAALDDRVAPVTLDEVLARAATPDQDREDDRDPGVS